MKMFIIILLLCLSFHLDKVFCLQPIIIDGPDSVNAVDGTTVQFSCVVVAKEIDYFVNSTPTNIQNIVDAGFKESTVDNLNDTTRRLNLTATALSQYNNTEVLCRGLNTVGLMTFPAFSQVAVLLVQGPLSSVVDVCHYFIDSSSLNISWNPPFTLPGTYITGYNISVTSIMFNISQFITDAYYVLTAPNNTDPCDKIIITVSGYNVAGNGEMTTVSSLYFPSVPSVNSSIPVTIEQNVTDGMVEITVLVNVSELCTCPGEYPISTDILITDSSNDTAIQNINDLMLMEGSQNCILTTVNTITLQSDMRYTIQVSFSNLDGEFNTTTGVNFTTFDTQSIDITSTSGEVCVVCRFSINTIAVGCEIELQNNNETQTGRFDRDVNNIAEGCISNIITGYYDLYVYDVENDNTLSKLPAFIKNQVFVDEQTTTTLSTTTTTTTTTTVTATTSLLITTLVTTSVTSAGYTMLPTASTSSPVSMVSSLSESVSTFQIPTVTEGGTSETYDFPTIYVFVPVCVAVIIIIVLVIIIVISVFMYKRRQHTIRICKIGLPSTDIRTVNIQYVSSDGDDVCNWDSKEVTTFQPNHEPVYANLARTKGKNMSKHPAPDNTTVVYSELMGKEQADIIRQQLEQKPPPYDDVQISSTSFQTSVTVIPPGIHGDGNVTTCKVEEGTQGPSPGIPTGIYL